MKMAIVNIVFVILIVYVIICGLIFLFQEKFIFFPEKLGNEYQFGFYPEFEEINFKAKDDIILNALLFHADSSNGLIFYLHGNAGSLRSWGEVAEVYTNHGYDLFMPDYRGYGKSEGTINSEAQLHTDMQTAYDYIRTRYDEEKIIVLGYSLGTGMAVKLASTNQPRLLILQAPFFSFIDMKNHYFPIIPTFLLKYRFETHRFIDDCEMPIFIFHGDRDEVIYYGSSLKLKKLLKEKDTLITLKGQRHNGMSGNPQYLRELGRILEN